MKKRLNVNNFRLTLITLHGERHNSDTTPASIDVQLVAVKIDFKAQNVIGANYSSSYCKIFPLFNGGCSGAALLGEISAN